MVRGLQRATQTAALYTQMLPVGFRSAFMLLVCPAGGNTATQAQKLAVTLALASTLPQHVLPAKATAQYR